MSEIRLEKEINERIKQIKYGQVPYGYKKTSVGIIPNEWSVDKLRNIAISLNERAKGKRLETLSITSGEGFVNQFKKFGRELSGKQYENYVIIKKGDFSYNRGNSKKYPQGCIYMLEDRQEAAVPNVFNSFRIEDQNIYYFKYLFIHGFLNKQLYKYINFGARNDGLLNLYTKDFYSCEVLIPPLHEQEKIVNILSLQNRIIQFKEKLLNHKRCIRKYLMKVLLTGKKRLKGFSDEWREVRLGDIGDMYAGGTPSTIEPNYWNNGNIKWIQSGLVQNNFINFKDVNKFITTDGLNNSSAKLIKANSILVAIIGSTCANIGYIDFEATANQSVVSITPYKEDSVFIFYLLLNERSSILRMKGGSAQGGVTLNDLRKLVIKLPSISEQRAIVNILMKADREIKLLEEIINQEKCKQKSLMQLLLTGIIRV